MMDRVLAMLREATVDATYSPVGIPGLDHLAGSMDKLPYFSCGLGPLTFAKTADEVTDSYIVRIRLVAAHVTQGYQGNAERVLLTYVPKVRKYLAEHPLLTVDTTTSAYYRAAPAYLAPTGAMLLNSTGTGYFQEPEIMQVGVEFQLNVPVQYTFDPKY